MNENWELLQQSLSEASEAAVAQSHKKREKNSVRLSSKRGSVKFRMLMYHVGRKKGEMETTSIN